MTTVLVTGATGAVGSAVVRELVSREVRVRAFVRDAGRAAAVLGEEVQTAVGDFADADSLTSALAGVDRLFLACGNVPGQPEHEGRAIDAAVRAGVQRIVKVSAHGAQVGSPLTFWDWHGRIERHLEQSGIPSVVLRPTGYMTNLLASARAVAQTGRLFAPAGSARVAMIDPRDVAAVAAAALTDGHGGGTHVLTGPRAVTYGEVAGALAQATGRPVEYVDVPGEAARRGLAEAGVPDLVADFVVGMFEALRSGAHATATDAVRALSGAAPRSVAQFAREHAAAFGGPTVAESRATSA